MCVPPGTQHRSLLKTGSSRSQASNLCDHIRATYPKLTLFIYGKEIYTIYIVMLECGLMKIKCVSLCLAGCSGIICAVDHYYVNGACKIKIRKRAFISNHFSIWKKITWNRALCHFILLSWLNKCKLIQLSIKYVIIQYVIICNSVVIVFAFYLVKSNYTCNFLIYIHFAAILCVRPHVDFS